MLTRLGPALRARGLSACCRGSALLEWLILCAVVCGVLVAGVKAFGRSVEAMFGCLGRAVSELQPGPEFAPRLAGCWSAARGAPQPGDSSPEPPRGVGKAQFAAQDYTIELEQSGLKPYLTDRISIALGMFGYAGCESLTPGKTGKVMCPAFGVAGAAIGYWVPEVVLPSWVRLRDVHGVGDVRGDGDTTSRLMSFGVGSTPRYESTPRREGGEPDAEAEKERKRAQLRHRMGILVQLLSIAAESDMPGTALTVLLGRVGWDWEYDVQCVAESLQTQTCYLGTRLSTTCRSGALRCKTTSRVQAPVQLEPELIRAFLSQDFETRRKAFFQISMGHAMDQPLLSTLRAASASLGFTEGPIAPLLPPGGSYLQRFEVGADFQAKHRWLDRLGARISATPTLQVGKIIRADGRQLLTIRMLDTLSGGLGVFATRHQAGPQLLVDIGAEGQTADSDGVLRFVDGLAQLFDSGEVPASGRQPAALALDAALDEGSIALDPAARDAVEQALKRLAAPPE